MSHVHTRRATEASGAPQHFVSQAELAKLVSSTPELVIEESIDIDESIDMILDDTGGGAGHASEEADGYVDPKTLERPPISAFDVDAATLRLLAEKGITDFTPIQVGSFPSLAYSPKSPSG